MTNVLANHGFEEKSGNAINGSTGLNTGCTFSNTQLHALTDAPTVHGLWALKTDAQTTATGNQKILGASTSSGTLVNMSADACSGRIYVYPTALPASGSEHFFAIGSSSSTFLLMDMRVNGDGSVDVYDYAQTGVLGTIATGILQLNTWNLINFRLYHVSGGSGLGTNCSWAFGINGTFISGTSYAQLNLKHIDFLWLGKHTANLSGQTVTAYWDDLLMWDDTANYPGEGVVLNKTTSADGSRSGNSGWAPSTGNAYQCIDEIPFVDSGGSDDRITATAAGSVYTAALVSNATAGVAGTINCVKVHAVGFSGTSGGFKVVQSLGGTDKETTTAATSVSTSIFVGMSRLVDPSDNAWTLSNLNSTEVGVDLSTSIGNTAAIKAVYMLVDCNPVVAPAEVDITSPVTGNTRAAGTITVAHDAPTGTTKFRIRVDGGSWTITDPDTATSHDVSISEGVGVKASRLIEIQAGNAAGWSPSTTDNGGQITIDVLGLPAAPSDVSRAPTADTHQNASTDIIFGWEDLAAADVPVVAYDLVITKPDTSLDSHTGLTDPTYTKTGGFTAGDFTWKVRSKATIDAVDYYSAYSSDFNLYLDSSVTVGTMGLADLLTAIKETLLTGGKLNTNTGGEVTVKALAAEVITPASLHPDTFGDSADLAADTKAAIIDGAFKILVNSNGSIQAAVIDKAGYSMDSATVTAIASAVAGDPRLTTALPSGTVVTDVLNTSAIFRTDRAEAVTDYWRDCYLQFVAPSALAGQIKKVTGYLPDVGGGFMRTRAFTGTPADGDSFVIVNG